jgi:hypothetical protein
MAYRVLSAAIVACLAGLAAAEASAQTDLRAHEYRIASAEHMIDRLTTKIARSYVVCDEFTIKAWMPRLSEACTAAVRQATPMLTTIRQVAERGDPVEWAKLVDHVHKFEAEIEGPLYSSERNK